ncbi:MAG: HesB/IscA family protein [Poseidonia sp.]
MDCGTCESASPILTTVPDPVSVALTITPKAKSMLADAFGDAEGQSLLVGVLSGGCSGYMYDLQIVETDEQDCQRLDVDGITVQIPNASSHLLNGIEIDYIDRLMGGGFKINNPNAGSTCGCGESFG